jgi:DNA-binding NarL/FixJ family response regulator
MTVRILIADDHGVVRAGLRALLNGVGDLEVVCEAADDSETLRVAEELRPDIVLLDISMPGAGGIEATRRLRELLPATRVLILTVHEDSTLLREAIRAGAAGYLLKRAVEPEIMAAIDAVQRGELYVHPAMTRLLLQDPTPRGHPRGGDPSALSRRERDVVRLLARGYTNRQAAEELQLSARTVEAHRASLMSKLGLHNRAELVRWAAANKLLD